MLGPWDYDVHQLIIMQDNIREGHQYIVSSNTYPKILVHPGRLLIIFTFFFPGRTFTFSKYITQF